MPTATYATRRGELLQYFDRTAVDAWKRLTSDAPVNSIRATVRAGREDMRNTLLSWLPDDLRGKRILDAGCGTGAFSWRPLGAARMWLRSTCRPPWWPWRGSGCRTTWAMGTSTFMSG